MTRIDFYLNATRKDEVARKLASKAFNAGSHVLVFTHDPVQARELDSYFWMSQQLSFLPHVICGQRFSEKSPVLIGDDPGTYLQLDVLINFAPEVPDCFSRFERVLEVVSEQSEDMEIARGRFRYYKERGYLLDVHDLKALK